VDIQQKSDRKNKSVQTIVKKDTLRKCDFQQI